MECPNASSTPDAAAFIQLARGLEQMRDSLVELSLLLQDFRFEIDAPKRAEANWSVVQTLHKMGASTNGRVAR